MEKTTARANKGLDLTETSNHQDESNTLSQADPRRVADPAPDSRKKVEEETVQHEGAEHSSTGANSPFATPPQRFLTPFNGEEGTANISSVATTTTDDQVTAKQNQESDLSGRDATRDKAEDGSVSPVITKVNEPIHRRQNSTRRHVTNASISSAMGVSDWSHQALAPSAETKAEEEEEDDGWQEMPAYASYDMYDDDNKLIAKAADYESMGMDFSTQGGASKGYTRVQMDEDAQSATSLDDNTAYLFKENTTAVNDEDEDLRDPLAQMDTTKDLLTDNERIAYVGVTRLAISAMWKDLERMERTKGTRKEIDVATESIKMWSQKMMIRLYSHMELSSAEQLMIEQLADHGLVAGDLTPALMRNARVKNPMKEEPKDSSGENHPKSEESKTCQTQQSDIPVLSETGQDDKLQTGKPVSKTRGAGKEITAEDEHQGAVYDLQEAPPPYQENPNVKSQEVRTLAQMPKTEKIDIDLRWTVLCDLFLLLILDSVYDARSRTLLEKVGSFMAVDWLDICRFEKRVTDSLEMQEAANKEDWNEEAHLESRRKQLRKRRMVMMGLATVGGGIVIGLSAGLLAPVIGAGLAAGFTTIGVTGTSGFLAGAGGAAVIGTAATITGGTIGGRAANRRTGAVKTFEYRPLHNNKRVNLIVTVAGWMNGKVDDVRLPFSTIDPIMGDIYSILWEPEMLTSMGDTINILATEALTQGLQQILGSTILVALMAALQLPIVLTKLSYLIDNPWSVSLARADLAGLILADSLIDRNLGARPITLVGFSLGSRVIFSCLKELAKRGAVGIIQNAYLFGSPVVVRKDEYLRARTVVSGRLLNGYASNDWILGYLFRATSGGIMRVAGLAKVEIPGIENFDATEFVPGHMSYRKAMPRILREVGWAVESDEFTEIEDPDPENHERRQRELINEIEEARQELQKKPEKRRFGLFRKSRRAAEKKEWETYDERSQQAATADGEGSDASGTAIFDIDAIRREAIELATEGIEIKELRSTMPTMVVDTSRVPPSNVNGKPTRPDIQALRETKSYDMNGAKHINDDEKPRAQSMDYNGNQCEPKNSFKENSMEEEGKITMSFDLSPVTSANDQIPSPSQSSGSHSHNTISQKLKQTSESQKEPSLKHVTKHSLADIQPSPAVVHHNVWASDEEDEEFGKERDVELTFE